MVARVRRAPIRSSTSISDQAARLRFGGGINTLVATTDVQDDECVAGFNYALNPGDKAFRARRGVQKVFQAPNDTAITGYAALETIAGTCTLLLQAGATVYSWDGINTNSASNVGTVNASAKLRGTAQWALTADKCIVTDLALIEPVKEWNGSTLTNCSFTKDNGGNAYGTFRARYCVIHEERAVYLNVMDSSNTALPHLIVGSRQGNYLDIDTQHRASDSIGAADPWYLPTLDLKPICGALNAFGQLVVATLRGEFFYLVGSSPNSFAVTRLYAGPKLESYEGITSTGNDIVYAAQGVIESLSGVQNFGDVEKDDLSLWIEPTIRSYAVWRVTFNPRYRRLYCFPDSEGTCFVMSVPMYDSGLSPWMIWTTDVTHDFQPSLVFTAKNPASKLVETYLTDAAGGLYLVEADVLVDTDADDSDCAIQVSRTSKTFSVPIDKLAYYFDAQVEYVPTANGSLSIYTMLSGSFTSQHSTELTLQGETDAWYFGGAFYFGGEIYFSGSAPTRLIRQSYEASGQSDLIAVRLEGVASTASIINAINYRFEEVD